MAIVNYAIGFKKFDFHVWIYGMTDVKFQNG